MNTLCHIVRKFNRFELDGVGTSSATSAPIYVKNADKTVITLAENSQNSVSDGSASGELADGLVSGGSYTSGTQVASYTLSNVVTSNGGMGGGFGRRGPGGMRP